jgi:hypothetical protein
MEHRELRDWGFGAYQSLLTLRKLYATRCFEPSLIVYAFAGSDADRDVAEYWWVVAHLNASGEYFAPPSAIAHENRLVEYPLTVYRAWPFEHDVRLVALSKKAYLRLMYGGRAKYKDRVISW